MAHPRLDDPAYLISLLTEWGAPAAVQAALTAGGFTTLASVAFSVDPHSEEASSIRALLRITDDPLPVNPAIANARRLLRFAAEASGTSPSPPAAAAASPALSLVAGNASKLTSDVAKDLRAKFLANYPEELLSPDTTPSLHFLQHLRAALDDKGLLWVPWRLRSSEADALHWQEARRPRTDKQLRSLLLPDEDTVGPSASVSLSGPAEPTLRRMLAILAIALAMLGEAHLLVVRRFNERFLAYALAQHHDATLRGPTLQGILNADKSMWSTISGLVRDHSWSLTDAMNEVGFWRQDISALLQPRPKAVAPNPGKRPEPKRSATSEKTDSAGGNPPRRSRRILMTKKKPPAAEAYDKSWAKEIDGKEVCMRFVLGRCKNKKCRLFHGCPIPDRNGKPCGQNHTAAARQKAGLGLLPRRLPMLCPCHCCLSLLWAPLSHQPLRPLLSWIAFLLAEFSWICFLVHLHLSLQLCINWASCASNPAY